MSALNEKVNEIQETRVAFIGAYVTKFLKDTGCLIEDVFLVEEHKGDTWTWRLARKKKKKSYFEGLRNQNNFHPDQR